MYKKTLFLFFCLSLILGAPFIVLGWGVWGHQHINRAAVFALPQPMRAFYFNHIDFLTIDASVPDMRKRLLNFKSESNRHFINVEVYGSHPFKELPETWDKAVTKYGKRKLYKNGILPWYIQLITEKLTRAFKSKNKAKILLLSADLAHYIGDAFQPLHTTQNYDGQLTGQKGIHAVIDSYIPEAYGATFRFNTSPAVYFNDFKKASWDIVKQSHSQVQPLLKKEKKLLMTLPKGKLYERYKSGKVRRNRYGTHLFSESFINAYYESLDGMIERQMQKAIQTTASFW